jgi:two-component system NarL family sensor kinase
MASNPETTRRPRDGGNRDSAAELGILNSVATALNSAGDVRQALEKTLSLAADLLGLQTGWVWLLNPDSQQFYLAAAQNLPPYLQEPVRMSGRWCLCTELFRQGKLKPTNVGMMGCSRLAEAVSANTPEATLGLRYHASIPLYFQARPLGIINVTGPADRELSEQELRLLGTIASQVGVAVERARLAEESTRLARSEERARIAREIHDTLAQDLTGIGLDIEGALTYLDKDPSRARERLERALTTARGSLEEARRSVLNLRGGPTAGRSLPDALVALGRTFTADTGIQVQVECQNAAPVPEETEAELYRIAQEALANVRKHAQATRVRIELNASDAEVVLTVRDDGVGYESRQEPDDGYGLRGMRERVKLLNGHIRISGRQGRGTALTVRVPRSDPEAM